MLCYECFKKIKTVKTSLCPICHRITKDFQLCPNCGKKEHNYLQAVITCCHYDSQIIKKLIYDFKYYGFVDLAETFAAIMANQIPKKYLKDTVLSFVPLYKTRRRIRGFNQSYLLAKNISGVLNLKIVDCLEKIKNTKSQATLLKKDRSLNIIDAFILKKAVNIKSKNVIIIDDVASTCSTLVACAKLLKKAGYRNVIGCVIARNI